MKNTRHLKLPINRFEDGNSEHDHEDQGEDCEADVDLEHVDNEHGKLEEVAKEVRHFPGYDVHDNQWIHRALKNTQVRLSYVQVFKQPEYPQQFLSRRRPSLDSECAGKDRLSS